MKFNKLEILNLGWNEISNNINILENVNFKELKELDLSRNNIIDIKVLDRVKFNKLTEENRSLKTTINDTALSDIQTTADLNNPKAMRIKISFLEKTIEQLEKERSELNMRCTMAEEQLKNFQEMFNSTTQGYQKKILELNKRLEAANLRLNQDYLGAGDN